MTRYLAIARPPPDDAPEDRRMLSQNPGLIRTETASWILWHDAATPLLRMDDDTLLYGHVFDRRSNAAVVDASAVRACSIDAIAFADHLSLHYWGSYLALGGRGDDGARFVFRDPTGGIPAFYGADRQSFLLGSGLDCLHAGGAAAGEIDWPALAAHFLQAGSAGPTTCIRDVRELLSGALLRIRVSVCSVRQCWRPADVTQRGADIDMARAAEGLRHTILASVGAWARIARKPLLELSGGLDSSIVAAAAARVAPTVACATLATPGRDGDERRLARSVATHLGLPLMERERDMARVDLARPIAPHWPRPGIRGFSQEADRLIDEMADAAGADMLLNGGGGDSLFCKLETADPLRDRLRIGARPGQMLRTACDTADVAQQTLWSLLRSLRRSGRNPVLSGQGRRWRLMPDPVPDGAVTSNPLLEGLSDLPPGRAAHVADMVAIGQHRFGMARAARRPMAFPLMAQPVQEACLSFPTWLWVQDGRDRSIAREAFRGLLPDDVVFRRSKGRLDVFGHSLFDRHRETIRALLLEGALAANGLLDRNEVERQLASSEPWRTSGFFLLLELADIEAWIHGVRSRTWALS